MERADVEAAVELWESAIAIAAPAQEAGGSDGPEASGVLFEVVEALWRLGRPTDARRAADQISLDSLRERRMRCAADLSLDKITCGPEISSRELSTVHCGRLSPWSGAPKLGHP